jgi:hypothetical protein
MNATATKTTKTTFAAMNTYCVSRYGYDLLKVEATVAMWVAEHFGSKANWKLIASRREKAGLYMPFPAFKSACWA